MNRSQVLVSMLLALFAAITGWMVYLRVEPPRPDRFTGPSRPDYELIDFELDAFPVELALQAVAVAAPWGAEHRESHVGPFRGSR